MVSRSIAFAAACSLFGIAATAQSPSSDGASDRARQAGRPMHGSGRELWDAARVDASGLQGHRRDAGRDRRGQGRGPARASRRSRRASRICRTPPCSVMST